MFNPTQCEKPVAKLILTALGTKCEYAVNGLKAWWWEEILQCSASARWRPGDLCKGVSKIKGTCAQLLPPYPEGLHQPPRMSDIVLTLQRTSQCLFLLKCKHLSPEILLQDWGTECYNHSLISNFRSTLQNHHPNELFLHFCSQTLWATFSLVFLEWEISISFKCAAKMYLIYCTYGTEMGKKEATVPPEQLENTLRFSRKQNMAFEFFFSGRRKLQITHRADVIFLWSVLYNSLRLFFCF